MFNKNNFCNSRFRWVVIAIGITAACASGQHKTNIAPAVTDKNALASIEIFEDIAIQKHGSGKILVFIPGLNSGKETFTETCNALVKNYQCLLIQLPGFASLTPRKDRSVFLQSARDSLIKYLRKSSNNDITLIGHSLGGILSLMIALQAPELINRLVIIDALPFYPAIQNPALTAELVRPQAEQMRQAMNRQSAADYEKNAANYLQGMSNKPENLPRLLEWSKTSDRATTTQAMYELMTTDLRENIAAIKQPTLVLGAWAAYKPFGATKDSTMAIYQTQYAKLQGVNIFLSDTSFHFLTWDDNDWVIRQLQQFLSSTAQQQ